jgi:hypothetical protein
VRASLQQYKKAHYFREKLAGGRYYRGLRIPEGVVEKQLDRAAVWTFQEAEVVGGSEIDSFNSRAEICTLRSQTRSFYTTPPYMGSVEGPRLTDCQELH